MSDFGTTVDTDKVEEDDSFAPVPKGDYDVIVDKAEVKETNDGTGKYMSLQLKVEGPTQAGRVLFDMVAISTTSNEEGKKKWVQIGHQKLKGLCGATGVSKPNDSQIFVGKRAKASVTVRPARGDYDASNEVKRYSASGANMPTGGAQPSKPAESSAPWAK